MLAIIEHIIEALYAYQTSLYYKLHFVLIIFVALTIIWLLIRERKIKSKDENPTDIKCSAKVDYFTHITNKQKETDEALSKLVSSPQYQKYLAEKSNPNSRLNSKYSDEEI
jgi:hypothetical protein